MPLSTIEKNPTSIKYWRKNPKALDKFQFIYHFLPHPEKKTRATLLSHKSILVYCLLIFLVTGLFRLIPLVFPGVLGYASDVNIRDLLTYTNQRRKVVGLSELRLNAKLTQAAEEKAVNMFEKNYWAHVAPDGTEPWDFILRDGYDYIYAGENLAKNFSTSKDVLQAWYDSPSHRDNLLSTNYDEVGFAVQNGILDGYETTLVVQMFGRPRSPSQIASVFEEDSILKEKGENKIAVPIAAVSPNGGPEVRVQTASSEKKSAIVDLGVASKTVSLAFGGFVGSLLALDVWYSKKKGILKFTGHTFAHLTLLVLVIVCIWFFIRPGVII